MVCGLGTMMLFNALEEPEGESLGDLSIGVSNRFSVDKFSLSTLFCFIESLLKIKLRSIFDLISGILIFFNSIVSSSVHSDPPVKSE